MVANNWSVSVAGGALRAVGNVWFVVDESEWRHCGLLFCTGTAGQQLPGKGSAGAGGMPTFVQPRGHNKQARKRAARDELILHATLTQASVPEKGTLRSDKPPPQGGGSSNGL